MKIILKRYKLFILYFHFPIFFTEAANAEINVFIFWSMFTIDLC